MKILNPHIVRGRADITIGFSNWFLIVSIKKAKNKTKQNKTKQNKTKRQEPIAGKKVKKVGFPHPRRRLFCPGFGTGGTYNLGKSWAAENGGLCHWRLAEIG